MKICTSMSNWHFTWMAPWQQLETFFRLPNKKMAEQIGLDNGLSIPTADLWIRVVHWSHSLVMQWFQLTMTTNSPKNTTADSEYYWRQWKYFHRLDAQQQHQNTDNNVWSSCSKKAQPDQETLTSSDSGHVHMMSMRLSSWDDIRQITLPSTDASAICLEFLLLLVTASSNATHCCFSAKLDVIR